MADTDIKFPDNLRIFSTQELRRRYQLLDEELIYRRDELFDEIKEDLEHILQVIHDEGYKLQIVDYTNSENTVDVNNIYQFDLYDPVIETSEI